MKKQSTEYPPSYKKEGDEDGRGKNVFLCPVWYCSHKLQISNQMLIFSVAYPAIRWKKWLISGVLLPGSCATSSLQPTMDVKLLMCITLICFPLQTECESLHPHHPSSHFIHFPVHLGVSLAGLHSISKTRKWGLLVWFVWSKRKPEVPCFLVQLHGAFLTENGCITAQNSNCLKITK